MGVQDISVGRLYGELAFLMPWLTPPEAYVEEAGYWLDVLRVKIARAGQE